MTTSDTLFAEPRISPLGLDGILVQFADRLSEPANRAALAFRSSLAHADIAGAQEIASSLTSVLIRFDPTEATREKIDEALRSHLNKADWSNASLPEGRTRWRVPVAFGGENGPQLEEAAEAAGVSADQAVSEITSQSLRVLAVGFAPGQPYLGFLPEHWNIPRQSGLTEKVPIGAVVVAVRQVIPFATSAPTGWRQIGRTAFRCYDAARKPALPLSPGDEIAFEAISATEMTRFQDADDRLGGATREVIS